MTINSHEFPLPNKLGPETLRVIPLGGIGEIGRNMTVMQYNQDIVIVDVGVLFPEENQPGVDLILPDFEYLRDKWQKVKAIVLLTRTRPYWGSSLPFKRSSTYTNLWIKINSCFIG